MDLETKSKRIEAWLASLQESGYRLTAPRRTLVEIIATSERMLSPIELYDMGRKEHPGLGLVTVYRTLEKLEQLGLAQRVHQPEGCHMYLRATEGHQHLLVCTSCGHAAYFHGDDIEPLMARVAEISGYQVNDHWLQLFGLCPSCQTKA